MSLAGLERILPGYQPRDRYQADVQRWILRTSVEELAEHVFAGIDLDAPPVELILIPPQGGSAVVQFRGPPRPVETKTPSAGQPFKM